MVVVYQLSHQLTLLMGPRDFRSLSLGDPLEPQ